MPLRLLFATLLIFAYPLFAEKGGCFKFFPGSFEIVDSKPAFAVAKNRFVSIECPKGKKIISHDRFTGLCIFEDEASKPLFMSEAKPPLFICPEKKRLDSAILSYPVSIFPGELSIRPKQPGALFSGCCRLAGLFDEEGRWFDAALIKRVLENRIAHGDIGVRFKADGGGVRVEAVDPFAGSALKPGDRVVKIGRESRPSLRRIRELVDRCRPSQTIGLTVERGEVLHEVNATCFDRLGGGRVSDTFLERFGMEFSPSLGIKRIDLDSIPYKKGLRIGDRLMMIDGKRVEKEAEVRAVLSGYAIQKRTPKNMLWEREGFQFFLLPTSL